MTITEIYGKASPDALINAIAAQIAEKMKEEKKHEHLGASGNRSRAAGTEHPAAACESC